ncbi:hypothetical protein ICM_05697 [Bacillus cereus BAG1X2-3]|uniref:Integrase n=1 Tax=Bacillus cereus TaxID=1396 RepID=A0A9X7HPH0_BACCE|nr:hypothetical protein ICC_06139 [Bacillus cereus BAG1X1-1]EOO43052.1 hypothetical protein ICI_06077 [Bacillus cereus BAG1X2-1]EOO56402.1 hypothetical protein ICM_05697 [Bacillus cereus BAG1X2-3]EOP00141.1 hypothetical protein ICO_06504 [Bacillus cereus BAG2O-1]PHA06035.1 hypothetical protein COE70_33485 [Bacillus cereus]
MNYIDSFQCYLQEEGKRNRTIEEYVAAVLALEKWVFERTGENFNPDFLTSRDLHEWVSFMQTVEKLAPATINKRVAAIKVYWSYLIQAGYSILNPTIKVKRKRISPLAQAPRWLSRLEQDKFLHQIHKEKNAWKKSRNLAIVQIMLQAGLRISEVVSLDIEDIDLKRRIISVSKAFYSDYETRNTLSYKKLLKFYRTHRLFSSLLKTLFLPKFSRCQSTVTNYSSIGRARKLRNNT